jgi:hypothetical protein
VGQADQFAKRTFAKETKPVTGGAVAWQNPPEIGLTDVQSDGMLLVCRPELLSPLAAPWPEARGHDEVMIEVKMPGDHLDHKAVERAFLRRQARQVQRIEAVKKGEPPWLGQEPLWIVAPHVPQWAEGVAPARAHRARVPPRGARGAGAPASCGLPQTTCL